MPSTIEQVHQQYRERGLKVVAINIQEPKDKVAAWVRDKKVTFRVALDPDGAITGAYRVTATPTVFVLSRAGKLVGVAHGTKQWTSASGRALLDALVAP